MIASNASAQVFQQPGDKRPALPDFEPRAREQGSILPPVRWSQEPSTDALSAGQRVFVREYEITGGTVFTRDELSQITADFVEREVSFAELEQLRDRLTLAYVSRGYVTSGAALPDQTIKNGLVQIILTEGVLTRVDIKTDGRYRTGVLRPRVAPIGEHVNVADLEKSLQLLQRDERIRSVQARLVPTEKLGESVVELDVVEETPYRFGAEASNHASPAVGAYRGRFNAAYLNVLGLGDRVAANFDIAEGLYDISASYEVPLGPYGTTLEFHGGYSESEVVEMPFDDLGIESESWSFGSTASQPVYRTLETNANVFMTFDVRQSESFLLGTGFSFSAGPEDGKSRLAILRLGGDWSHRTREQVVVVRTQFSFGLDALGATSNSGTTPDGDFFSWLGQAQVARRLPLLDTLLIGRLDVQLTPDGLLGLEQFAVGGHSSVRGYRENALVRDNGLLTSLEARVPVLKRADGTAQLEMGPFVDYGRSWNENRTTPGPEDVLGIGFAVRASLTRWITIEASWAEDVIELDDPADRDLQDDGFQFRVGVQWP